MRIDHIPPWFPAQFVPTQKREKSRLAKIPEQNRESVLPDPPPTDDDESYDAPHERTDIIV